MKLTLEQWNRIVRLFAASLSLVFLYIGASLSTQGFGIELPDKKWLGWTIAIGFVVLQLILNRLLRDVSDAIQHFPILFIAGFLSYVYGIYANILGLNLFSGDVISDFKGFVAALGDNPIQTFVGVTVELLPESMLIWAITSGDQMKKFSNQDKSNQSHGKHHSQPPKDYHSVREFVQHNRNRPVNPEPSRMKKMQTPKYNFDLIEDFMKTGELDNR